MILRPATLEDAVALARLGRESFCAAFEHLYRPEDLGAFLKKAYAPEVVASEIASPDYIHFLAQDAQTGELAAFCKMKHPSDYAQHSHSANPIALCQLYTAPSRTGKAIGATLMDWALGEAHARQCDAVQLSVWSENLGAQRFYSRYGFSKIADISFWVGNHRDDEFLFELQI